MLFRSSCGSRFHALGDKMNVTKEKLNEVLFSFLGREDLVKSWWVGPNYAFGLQAPADLWEEGEVGQEMVTNYILGQLNGDYS